MSHLLTLLRIFGWFCLIATGIFLFIVLMSWIFEMLLSLIAPLRDDDGGDPLISAGFLALCACIVALSAGPHPNIALCISACCAIVCLYCWWGCKLRKHSHLHTFDTLREEKDGYAVLSCKCGKPYCLVRISHE